MKNMKKLIALALVAITVLAVAVPAMAAYRPWQYEWNVSTLFPNTFPPAGSTLRTHISNFQSAINELRARQPAFSVSTRPHYFPALTADGLYGTRTTDAVKMIQSYYGLSVDGAAGVQTKNKIWNELGRTPYAD